MRESKIRDMWTVSPGLNGIPEEYHDTRRDTVVETRGLQLEVRDLSMEIVCRLLNVGCGILERFQGGFAL